MVVCLVHLVSLVCLVGLVQPNKQDKPNKPNKRDRRDRPNRPDRPNEQDRPADFFSILLETLLLAPHPVNRLWHTVAWPICLTTERTSEKYSLSRQRSTHSCDQPCGTSLPSPSWSDSSTSLAMPSIRFNPATPLRQRVRLVRSLRPSPSGLATPVYGYHPQRST